MYTEFQLKSRETWKYLFRGHELLPYVTKLLEKYTNEEADLRKQLSSIMEDRTKSLNSEETNKLKKRLEFVATENEKLKVWHLVFKRDENRDFNLEIGDIVYFQITE